MRGLVLSLAQLPVRERDDAPREPEVADSAPEAEGARAERAVLDHVLTLHPDHLTIPALVQDMVAGCIGFGDGAELERAIVELTGRGLLRIQSGLVAPTRAALDLDAPATLAGLPAHA
jgi:hypothetical protein